MGMSTHVIGFKPPDEKWQKMKAVWDSCKKAGVDIPPDVEDFFNGEPPDDMGVEVELPVHEWRDDMRRGFELYVSELPVDVKVIRFYNSW